MDNDVLEISPDIGNLISLEELDISKNGILFFNLCFQMMVIKSLIAGYSFYLQRKFPVNDVVVVFSVVKYLYYTNLVIII